MSVATVLSGVRVVEIASGVAGPMAACRLADLAADVVKVETGEGDWMRRCPPFLPDGETGATFFALNRGKRGLKADDTADGPSLVRALVEAADVLVTDRSDEELAALGLAGVEADVCPFNPRLVVARISALGSKGPLAGRPGSELGVQAMAGYTRYVGAADAPPIRLGADVAGCGTAIFTVQAVLAALVERRRTGRGQRVDLSLLGSLIAMKTVHLAAQSDPDHFEGPRVGGAYDPPERGWETADSPITFAFGGAVGASGRPGWTNFVDAVGLAHLLDDDRFDKTGRATTGLGPKARALKGEYEAQFRQRSADEIVAAVRKHGGFASKYMAHRELMAEPQVAAMEAVTEVDGPDGPVRTLDYPARFSGSRPRPRGQAPTLGQHTGEIAREIARRPA